MVWGGNYIRYTKINGKWVEDRGEGGCKQYHSLECWLAEDRNLKCDIHLYVMDGDTFEETLKQVTEAKKKYKIRIDGLEKEMDYKNNLRYRKKTGDHSVIYDSEGLIFWKRLCDPENVSYHCDGRNIPFSDFPGKTVQITKEEYEQNVPMEDV